MNDNFFDLGAHSLTVAEVHAKLQEALGREIALVDLFQFSTVSTLAAHLAGVQPSPRSQRLRSRTAPQTGARRARGVNAMKPSAIAIVGMAGRFPGARNLAEFWQNLRDGVESIRDLTDAELLAAGASPEDLANPDYVQAAPQSSTTSPCSMHRSSASARATRPSWIRSTGTFWNARGRRSKTRAILRKSFDGSIGVFAGSGMNTYLIHNLLANRRLLETAGLFQLKQTGNDKDVLATRVSYQLDLRGPSINVQTACSTSLVAVHLACQSLLNFECDMALAGGVTIEIPHGQGYIYREGEILSRDGHCRSFDAASSGTVFGSGLGIVVLRRLEDALADHDHIHAVILGSAINNDGARKVGYLAPSVEGQAEVIAEALDFAGVSADDISYVETHGTGTVVGDPIEVSALTQAFRKSTARERLLRNRLAQVQRRPSRRGRRRRRAHQDRSRAGARADSRPAFTFEKLNPHIELEGQPVLRQQQADATGRPTERRAAPVSPRSASAAPTRTSFSKKRRSHALARSRSPISSSPSPQRPKPRPIRPSPISPRICATHPELNLADVAFTCQLGRQAFPHRRALVVEDAPEAIAALAQR